jgi:hypothetical protein
VTQPLYLEKSGDLAYVNKMAQETEAMWGPLSVIDGDPDETILIFNVGEPFPSTPIVIAEGDPGSMPLGYTLVSSGRIWISNSITDAIAYRYNPMAGNNNPNKTNGL